jgi:choice-of-anchor C domain-containing protein
MKLATTILALLIAGVPTAEAGASVVINGSFEQGPASVGNFVTFGTGSTAITGWTVTQGSIDLIGRYWNHSDGARSLDLSGNQAGTIAQMIPTIAGMRYTVSFDISSNPDRSYAKSMLVGFGSATPVAITLSGPVQRPLRWTSHVLDFIASGPSTQLSFRSTTSGPSGMALDNVAVVANPVPEPASWAMMIAGFGLVGAMMRRRPSGMPRVTD